LRAKKKPKQENSSSESQLFPVNEADEEIHPPTMLNIPQNDPSGNNAIENPSIPLQ